MKLNNMTIQRHSCPAWITLGPLAAEAAGLVVSALGRSALLCEDVTPRLTRRNRILVALATAGGLP